MTVDAEFAGTGRDMAGEIEAFGGLTTAGLAASQLDGPGAHPARRGVRARPVRGAAARALAETGVEHDPHDLAHGACANCVTVLSGNFCHACGQSAHVHRSVGHIFEEFLHGIWHFDSKAWQTLPLLIFRPGRLTRDYVYGKRAAYIAPLALFLLSVFLMFFVFGFIGGPDVNGALNAAGDPSVAEARMIVAEATADVKRARDQIAVVEAKPDSYPGEAGVLAGQLAAKEAALGTAQQAVARAQAVPVPTDKATGRWQDQLADGARSGKLKVNSGFPAVDARIREALQNPDFALYRIEQKAYKLSFLLIPMSLPVLWLLFVFRRDVHTYDHVVFALYSLSFMSLLFVVIALVAQIDPTAGSQVKGGDANLSSGLDSMLLFAVPVHMFVQLKGAYRLGTFGALWRTFVLSIASVMTLSLFAVLIVVVGLAD